MRKIAGILLLTLAVSACSLGLSPTLLPNHVRQRTSVDCLLASLATLGGWTYEQAETARIAAGITYHDGLDPSEAVTIAARLGKRLQIDYTPNPVQEDGIFVAKWGDPSLSVAGHHAVYLQDGWVYDPSQDQPQPWVLWLTEMPGTHFVYVIREAN